MTVWARCDPRSSCMKIDSRDLELNGKLQSFFQSLIRLCSDSLHFVESSLPGGSATCKLQGRWIVACISTLDRPAYNMPILQMVWIAPVSAHIIRTY